MPALAVSKTIARNAFSARNIQLGPAPQMGGIQTQFASLASQAAGARPPGMVAAGRFGASPSPSPSSAPGGGQTATPLACPPALFRAASNSKADVDYQKSASDGYTAMLEVMIDAIVFAHDTWRQQAHFSDIKIMAISAIGGKLNGPALEANIRNAPSVAACSGNSAKLRDGVAKGVSDAFQAWQRGVTVPGLPWYPAFAAWPGAMAPPMPNVPSPLLSCPSPGAIEITTPSNLMSRMKSSVAPGAEHADPFCDALSKALAPAFAAWIAAQMITTVLGTGSVPGFAPPYVPVGSVMNGTVVAVPGHLST